MLNNVSSELIAPASAASFGIVCCGISKLLYVQQCELIAAFSCIRYERHRPVYHLTPEEGHVLYSLINATICCDELNIY